MILPIYLLGNTILRKTCTDVKPGTDMKQLYIDFFETMGNSYGCGLAAPQVGIDKNFFAIYFDHPECKNSRKIFAINPKISIHPNSPKSFHEEGCLSLPGINIEVERPDKILFSYYDQDWDFHEEVLEDFISRIALHEYDHLRGILITDYCKNEEGKKIEEDLLKKINDDKLEINYPVKNFRNL